jgi:hypothetical protein
MRQVARIWLTIGLGGLLFRTIALNSQSRHPEVRASSASLEGRRPVCGRFILRGSLRSHLRMTDLALYSLRAAHLPAPLRRKQLFQDLPADAPVGRRSLMPSPAVALHLLGGGNKAVGDRGKVRIGVIKVRIGVIQAEGQPAGSDPTQRQPFGAQLILQHPAVTGWFCIMHHPDRHRSRSRCRRPPFRRHTNSAGSSTARPSS